MGTETRNLAQSRIATRLDGKWFLDTLLGYGGSAAVYAATHRNGKRAAIKVLHPHCVADEALRTRFVREGYVANKIGHPGAVSVLDDDVADDGTVFLVMELLEGTSLEKVGRGDALPLTMGEVVRIAGDLLDVLAKAHAIGIVHRDIKPANLFVTTTGQLKVLDFGIARLGEAALDGSPATQTGFMMGTPAFMPPEQARARWAEVDGRSDLWAVGATMIALMLGRRPRVAETPNEELLLAMTAPLPPVVSLVPNVPPPIGAIIDRAVAFNRDERWPSAEAMQQALRAAARESEPSLNAPATLVQSVTGPPPAVNATLVAPLADPRTGPPRPPASFFPSPVSAVSGVVASASVPAGSNGLDVEAGHGLTTSRPVLNAGALAPQPPPRRSPAGVIAGVAGIVVALALLAGGGLYARSRALLASGQDAESEVTAASAPAATTPSVEPSPPAATTPSAEPPPAATASAVSGPLDPTPVPGDSAGVARIAAGDATDGAPSAGVAPVPSVTTPSSRSSTTAAAASARGKPASRPQPSSSANPAKYFDSRY